MCVVKLYYRCKYLLNLERREDPILLYSINFIILFLIELLIVVSLIGTIGDSIIISLLFFLFITIIYDVSSILKFYDLSNAILFLNDNS